jgi:hypothetical protein
MQLKSISGGDLEQEEKLRWMSKYDFNFHILFLRKRQQELEANNKE